MTRMSELSGSAGVGGNDRRPSSLSRECGSRDSNQLPAISSRPANFHGESRGLLSTPEERDRVAMFAVIGFALFVGCIGLIAWGFVSMIVDWYGVCEGAERAIRIAFRCFDFG